MTRCVNSMWERITRLSLRGTVHGMTTLDEFLGVFVLDAERGDYGELSQPTRGVQTLRQVGDALSFHVHFTDDEGEVNEMAFRTSMDGTWRSLGAEGIQARSVLKDDELRTEIRADDAVVHRSNYTIEDGELHVQQLGIDEDGPWETHSVYTRSSVKQVIVYRRDLKMRKGKIAAQVAHASLRAVFLLERPCEDDDEETMTLPLRGPVAEWIRRRFAKVVLSVDDEEALLRVHELAKERGIPTAIIMDSGKTEFGGVPTRTTVAVGPWASDEIDMITGRDGAVKTKLA